MSDVMMELVGKNFLPMYEYVWRSEMAAGSFIPFGRGKADANMWLLIGPVFYSSPSKPRLHSEIHLLAIINDLVYKPGDKCDSRFTNLLSGDAQM